MSLLSVGFWFPWKIPSLPRLPKAIAKRRIKCFFGTHKVPYAIKQIASRLETGAWMNFKDLYLRKCQNIAVSISKGKDSAKSNDIVVAVPKGHSAKLRPINKVGVDFKEKPTGKGDFPLIELSIRTKNMVKKEREIFPIIKNNHSRSIVHKEQKIKKEKPISMLEKSAVEMAMSSCKEDGINPTARNISILKRKFEQLILKENKAKEAKKAKKAITFITEVKKSSKKEEVPLDEEQKYNNFLRRQTEWEFDDESVSSDSSDVSDTLEARIEQHRLLVESIDKLREEQSKKGQKNLS
jgi:hypothetical protein